MSGRFSGFSLYKKHEKIVSFFSFKQMARKVVNNTVPNLDTPECHRYIYLGYISAAFGGGAWILEQLGLKKINIIFRKLDSV